MKMFLGMIFLSATAHAALPPYYQSAREIEMILKSRAVAEAMHSVSPIQEIKRTEQGYTVSVDGCFVAVKVKYLPNTNIGPAKFEIEVVDSGCRKQ